MGIAHFMIGLPLLCLALAAPAQEEVCTGGPITVARAELIASFADNTASGEQHREGYNGIADLRHVSAKDNLFVPFYSGFNLEHFFGGDHLEELFEPREQPMVLTRVDDRTVRLHQPPTPRSRVETTTTFAMVAPHYIDAEVEVVFHDLREFRHGYAGLFWASYINAPESGAIHFWGICEDDPEPRWIEAYSPQHGVESTHLHLEDDFDAHYAEDFNVTLAKQYSKFRYIEPFYFGLRGEMAFAIMFDRTEGIRFSQSPTGGGGRNPAWDFHLLIPQPEVGKAYSFKSRIVYKAFESAEDIRDEYKKWEP